MWQVSTTTNKDDLYEIEKIGKQSLPYYYGNIMLKYLSYDKNFIILKIADNNNDNKNIGGFLIARKQNNGQRLHINSIAIYPKYRHLGLGTKLLDKIKEYNCLDITLNVMETNDIAINFYEKNGFKRIKRLHNYYHELNKSAYAYCYDNLK